MQFTPIVLAAALVAGGALAQDKSTATVENRTVRDSYAADAVIDAVRKATVSAQISGTVTAFYVDSGDRVKRGQLLARIDPRETDAQVATGTANVAQARAALERARLDHERNKALVAKGFISQAALDQSDAGLKAAQASLEAAEAGRTQATTSRSFAELRAPIDGVITRRAMELGELAAPGRPVLEMYDPSALRAVGSIPQFALARVRAVRQVSVLVPAADTAIESTQVTVLPAADPRLLSTEIRADLPAKLPAGVVPGTAAKILVPVGSATKLVVPSAALIRRGEMTAVNVLGADGKVTLRQVRVGQPLEGGLVEVLAGLDAGERVQLNPLAPAR
ncbi:MAG: efflux RND transporter periplasmic adaptor subunit [Betaproteobacteria bacterium]